MLQPSLAPSLAERLAAARLDFRRLATRINQRASAHPVALRHHSLFRGACDPQRKYFLRSFFSICGGPESSGLTG
jgi:hypothetical protein